jgi:hypothetical protein
MVVGEKKYLPHKLFYMLMQYKTCDIIFSIYTEYFIFKNLWVRDWDPGKGRRNHLFMSSFAPLFPTAFILPDPNRIIPNNGSEKYE